MKRDRVMCRRAKRSDFAGWLEKPRDKQVELLKKKKKRETKNKKNPCLKIKLLIRHAKKAATNGWQINI